MDNPYESKPGFNSEEFDDFTEQAHEPMVKIQSMVQVKLGVDQILQEEFELFFVHIW